MYRFVRFQTVIKITNTCSIDKRINQISKNKSEEPNHTGTSKASRTEEIEFNSEMKAKEYYSRDKTRNRSNNNDNYRNNNNIKRWNNNVNKYHGNNKSNPKRNFSY